MATECDHSLGLAPIEPEDVGVGAAVRTALIGTLAGAFFVAAADRGLGGAFTDSDTELWLALFWGDHWFLRLVVSLAGTFLGAAAAGIVLPTKPRLAGFLSVAATMLLWSSSLAVALANLGETAFGLPSIEWTVDLPGSGWWITMPAVVILSFPTAWVGATVGSGWYAAHSYLFGIPGRPFGLHWTTWLWVWLPCYALAADLTYGAYTLINLDFSGSLGLDGFARMLLACWVFAVGYGAIQGLWYLAAGKHLGLTPLQVASRLVLYIILLPVAGNCLRALAMAILGT